MKKTKCDSNFPCKRCKDDGQICTAGVRKKREYKQLPQGYAEVLENTQLMFIATIYKLYSMVRNNEPWELGEPGSNDHGQPVVHDIAQKLGCTRPSSDINPPLHLGFPEDEVSMTKLTLRLEEQQKENESQKGFNDADSSVCNRTERASSSELDHSDIECGYPAAAFGNTNNAMTLSAQSFTGSSNDVAFNPLPPETGDSTTFPSQSPSTPNLPPWSMAAKTQNSDLTLQFVQELEIMGRMNMINQRRVESEPGTILASCHVPDPEIIMGTGDLMIYSGYDGEPILSRV
ncbi:Zn(2)-C6 fungal-type domain-containing protein [Fusarium keratoplasticum]|nr:Zn(2)-C6 fungal-type domain-containing protein [Fusarium keratoplasticum]